MITSVYPNDSSKNPKIASLSVKTNSIDLDKGFQFPNGEIELTNPQSNCLNNVVVSTDFRCHVNNTILVTEDRNVTPPEVRVTFPRIDFGPIRLKASNIALSKDNVVLKSKITDIVSNSTLEHGNYLVEQVDFTLLNNKTLTVNGGDEVFINTNKLTLGNVKIIGDGKITIYVNPGTNNFVVPSNGTVFGRVDKEEKLAIIVDTMTGVNDNQYHVTFPNNTVVGAHLMFENARIRFSQNSRLNGAIYTAAFNGNEYAVNLENRAHLSEGPGRALIVATNGKVYMSNNSSLSGAVIAYDFEQNNGGQSIIRYDADLFQEIPLDITEPLQNNNNVSKIKRLKVGPTIEG